MTKKELLKNFRTEKRRLYEDKDLMDCLVCNLCGTWGIMNSEEALKHSKSHHEELSEQEVLKKAFAIARANGWDGQIKLRDYPPMLQISAEDLAIRHGDYMRVIFDHSFAKCFWPRRGDAYWWDKYSKGSLTGEEWEYRMTQMVLAPNPLRYLEQFLDKPMPTKEVKPLKNNSHDKKEEEDL